MLTPTPAADLAESNRTLFGTARFLGLPAFMQEWAQGYLAANPEASAYVDDERIVWWPVGRNSTHTFEVGVGMGFKPGARAGDRSPVRITLYRKSYEALPEGRADVGVRTLKWDFRKIRQMYWGHF